MRKTLLISVFFLFLFPISVIAQIEEGSVILHGTAIDGDTLLFMELPMFEYIYYSPPGFKTRSAERQYTRMVKDIKKVYPFAKEAGKRLDHYAPLLDSLKDNKKEQKQYFDKIEAELWDKFGAELKKMNFRQGHLLIKLVDRECQITSYEVVKDFRGALSAFFWQGFAQL
ncbi:MAG: DUF4294 domain-containing protein [Bacteroidia bacterium]|nr:DUF4294 domain-containing protein [Bacteroidia bacterium]